jgi:hypothetical protein
MQISRQVVQIFFGTQNLLDPFFRSNVQQLRRIHEDIGFMQEIEIEQPLSVERAANRAKRIQPTAAPNDPFVLESRKVKAKWQECSKTRSAERTFISESKKHRFCVCEPKSRSKHDRDKHFHACFDGGFHN